MISSSILTGRADRKPLCDTEITH